MGNAGQSKKQFWKRKWEVKGDFRVLKKREMEWK